MEEILKQILSEVTSIKSEVLDLKEGQAEIIQRLDRIELGQTKDVMALLERTATKDSVARVETKIDLVNNKLFQTETEIALLKLVK